MDDRHSNPHLTLRSLDLWLDPHCWMSPDRALQLDRDGAPISERLLERAGLKLKKSSSAEVALSEAGAARWVLGLLLQDSAMRSRFARPLSGGINGEFAVWLRQEYARAPGATAQGKIHLDNLFRATPGDVVRQFYDHSIGLRKDHPLAQTPAGRWRFLRRLLQVGMRTSDDSGTRSGSVGNGRRSGSKVDRAYRINPTGSSAPTLTCFDVPVWTIAKEHGLKMPSGSAISNS